MPTEIQVPVAWGEMDSFNHVNNVVYFKYFESARIDYFMKINFIQSSEQPVLPILAEINCKFLKPLIFPDLITVSTKIISMRRSSFVMHHEIHSPKLGKVAEGQGVVVGYDYKAQKAAAIPAVIKEAIEAQEGRSFDILS